MNEREPGNRRLTFGRDNGFQAELRRRVDEYFRRTGRRQRDCPHQAYSNHAWVNRLMAMTMDLIGASSYVWHWKHVVVHHTYTNLTGHDAENAWAIHQAETTVDFARESRIESWLLGGLNFQIEHHPFPEGLPCQLPGHLKTR